MWHLASETEREAHDEAAVLAHGERAVTWCSRDEIDEEEEDQEKVDNYEDFHVFV